jgi:hypothetical protein
MRKHSENKKPTRWSEARRGERDAPDKDCRQLLVLQQAHDHAVRWVELIDVAVDVPFLPLHFIHLTRCDLVRLRIVEEVSHGLRLGDLLHQEV